MPRKKAPAPVPTPEELSDQLLPMPVLLGTRRQEHEHRVDPYKSLPGAMPEAPKAPKRGAKARKEELEEQARVHSRARLARYDRFLDNLADFNGDEVQALAIVYGISLEEVEARRAELLIDVQAGVPTSSIGEDLKRRHMGQSAIARVLAKWLYSGIPGASLKAAQMALEISGEGPDIGSFEQYARIATAET